MALLNAVAVLWVFRAALTRLPNTGDEVSVLFQAKIFASGRLFVPAPPFAERFAGPYIAVRNGHWSSIYPPGYPLVLALGLLLGKVRLLIALLSSAALLLLFRLVLEAYHDEPLAWLATLLLAVSPSFRFYSASYYTHLGSLVAVLLCLNLLPWASAARNGWAWPVAAFGLAIRPFSMGLALAPIAAAPWARPRGRREIAVAGALLAALLAYGILQFGGAGSVYLDVVDSGGRLAILRNLRWATAARVGAMLADAAKWTFGYGIFRSGNLKEVTAEDWNLSWPLALAALGFMAWEARRDAKLRRPHVLFLSIAAALALGHAFYDKQGGRFGERRFFEAHFVACLAVARAVLAGVRRFKTPWVWAAAPALCAGNLLVYFPGTVSWLRRSNEQRLGLFLELDRRGIYDAVVLIQDIPAFQPDFYARNAPDFSWNVFITPGPDQEKAAGLFPGRQRYVFRYDWSTYRYELAAISSGGGAPTPARKRRRS